MDSNAAPQDPGKVILVDKPMEWTSFDVVKKLKFALKIKKIGHAGTLDPLATGLLILCTGKKTKEIEKYQAQEKEYTGTITIGATTPSYDLETEPENFKPLDQINPADLKNAAAQLTGEIEQVPPMFSAVKIDGRRAYVHARKGEVVELKKRNITISVFELTEINLPDIKFRIVCSKGTYIIRIARDFGELLGVGGYLSELRSTRIGDFNVNEANTIEELTAK